MKGEAIYEQRNGKSHRQDCCRQTLSDVKKCGALLHNCDNIHDSLRYFLRWESLNISHFTSYFVSFALKLLQPLRSTKEKHRKNSKKALSFWRIMCVAFQTILSFLRSSSLVSSHLRTLFRIVFSFLFIVIRVQSIASRIEFGWERSPFDGCFCIKLVLVLC